MQLCVRVSEAQCRTGRGGSTVGRDDGMRWDGGGNRRFDQQEANCKNRLAMEDLRDAVLQQLRNRVPKYSK